MPWNFDNERPIYRQLVEQLEYRIITGVYPSGEKLPSVRDLAMETQVNPNTMQRALQELENNQLVETRRTSGKFVTNNRNLLQARKEKLAQEQVDFYYEAMQKLGFTKEEACYYINQKRKTLIIKTR